MSGFSICGFTAHGARRQTRIESKDQKLLGFLSAFICVYLRLILFLFF